MFRLRSQTSTLQNKAGANPGTPSRNSNLKGGRNEQPRDQENGTGTPAAAAGENGSVVALLELVDALLELLEPDDEGRDGEEDPVEEQRGGDEERVPLRLHDGLLVAEVLGRGARVLVVAGRAGLVLPVDVHEEEEAEGHHRHHRLERAPHHGDHPAAEAVEAREREEEEHHRLRARRVAQHHPLQRHGCRIEPPRDSDLGLRRRGLRGDLGALDRETGVCVCDAWGWGFLARGAERRAVDR